MRIGADLAPQYKINHRVVPKGPVGNLPIPHPQNISNTQNSTQNSKPQSQKRLLILVG